jgi:nucleoporin POM34
MSLARTASNTVTRAPATPSTPSTPSAQAEQSHTPGGSWKHPKFDEIARRQYATTFDERNVRAIVANASLLFLSVYGNAVTSKVKLLEYAACVLFPFLSIEFLTNLPSARQSTQSSGPFPTASGL